MKFHKWISIENLQLEIEKDSPAIAAAQMSSCRWIVTEKLDGANIGVNIEPESFRINSRTHMLAEDENFFGIYEHLDIIEPLVAKVQSMMSIAPHLKQITLQGEWFGRKVMNRIDYRRDHDVRFFGAYSIEEHVPGRQEMIQWTMKELDGFLRNLGHEDLMVPVIGIYDCFDDAIQVSNELPSALNPEATIEGIVIEPWNAGWTGYDERGWKSQMVFKSKNEKFRETPTKKQRTPVPDNERERIKVLNLEFADLCTESRMWSVLSRMGRPENDRDFGPYVGPFLNDAWEDFMKMHEGEEFSAKDRKAICSIGSNGYRLFSVVASRMLREGVE